MAIKVEKLAADSLADWLRLKLPAKVVEVNATRGAVLKSPIAGPFTFAGGMHFLSLSSSSRSIGTNVLISAGGVRTTAQVVATLTGAVAGLTPSADSADRLVLTAAAPTEGVPSVVALLAEPLSPTNAAFGWAKGGEHVVRVALPVPGWKEIRDGWPVRPDFGTGFWVVLGERSSVPVLPAVRRDEYLVTIDVGIFVAPKQQEIHGDREIIESAVQCVREVLVTDDGRKLGGAVLFTQEKSCKISGRPFKLIGNKDTLNPLFEMASMLLEVRVFERQPSS